jgi:hypothetical protein
LGLKRQLKRSAVKFSESIFSGAERDLGVDHVEDKGITTLGEVVKLTAPPHIDKLSVIVLLVVKSVEGWV